MLGEVAPRSISAANLGYVNGSGTVKRAPRSADGIAMSPHGPYWRAHEREHGFTLIELLIAMVLLGVVLAVAAGALVGGFGGSGSTGLSERTFTEFKQMSKMLEQDARAARAPGRDVDLIRDRDALADEVRTGRSSLPAGLDVMDVKIATPTMFRFVGDVVSVPGGAAAWGGAECVTWELVTGRRWSVRRTVSPDDAGCSARGAVTATWIQPKRAIRGAAPSRLFAYKLGCDTRACGSTGGSCSGTALVGTVTGVARGWITQVRIDMDALVASGRANAREGLTTSVTLRNRMSDDYQHALGCVAVQR